MIHVDNFDGGSDGCCGGGIGGGDVHLSCKHPWQHYCIPPLYCPFCSYMQQLSDIIGRGDRLWPEARKRFSHQLSGFKKNFVLKALYVDASHIHRMSEISTTVGCKNKMDSTKETCVKVAKAYLVSDWLSMVL